VGCRHGSSAASVAAALAGLKWRALGDGDEDVAGCAKPTQGRPMKRVARPAEIANAILWLASDLASFTTGAIQVVDGGVMAKAG
jgi:meso-butanediol dehydrogenase / (S,S)-butanediol dehydrogenase / diacetyl reductase